MSKVKIDIHDNSLENSADAEYLDMVDEGSYESAEERSNLVTQSFLDTEDNTGASYNFKEISSAVAYRFVPMSSGVEETISNQTSGSPTHILPGGEFYVIANDGEIYNPPTSGQKKASRKEPMPAKVITTKRRDDKRRATHNEVERRRRDKINSWIARLAALVPHAGAGGAGAGAGDAASKGGILAKACDYIAHLTDNQHRSEKLELENQKLVKEVIRLTQELSECRKQNDSLRSQVMEICIAPQRFKKDKS